MFAALSYAFFMLFLIDLTWLVAAFGLLAWGGIVLFKRPGRWKLGLGFVAVGALLMAARFVDCFWRVIHQCLGS